MSRIGRRNLWILTGITAVAALVRFATLDVQSFHHDEAVTAGRVLAGSFSDMLDHVVHGERSPPLYYLFAWPWSELFGTGEVGLRSLSALIGTLTIPAAYYCGRAFAGSRAGLTAACLFALNPYLFYYSQEARSYALMVLFATLALGAFAASERGRPGAPWWWAGFSALALLSHYFAIFLVIPQALWLMRPSTRAASLRPLLALVLAGLALAPLALTQQGDDRRDGFADLPLLERAAEVGLNYTASEEPDPLAGSAEVDAVQIGAGVAGLALFALAIGLIANRASPNDRHAAKLCALVAASVIGVPLLLAIGGIDLFNPRNLIAGIIPLLTIAAIAFAGTEWPARAGLVAGLALFAGVVLAVNVSAQLQREDWRGAAKAMGAATGTRIIVAPKNGDNPLEYYLDANKFEGGRFDDGVPVREVDVLSTKFEISPPKGFRLAEQRGLAPLFILRRYESERAVSITPRDTLRVLSERSQALIDRP